MIYPILLTVGIGAICAMYLTRDEVYRLTWIVISFLAFGWGYLASPTLIKLLSLMLILSYGLISVLKTNRS